MAEPQVPVRLARLSCRICARLLREPVTIPCGHSFCRRCISGSWAGVEAGFGCPECRRTFPSRPALIRNATLAEVVGDTARSWSGNESRRGGGGGGGGADPPPKRARSGAEPPGGTWCRRHASPLDVYRCSDEELVCARCASEEHTGHVIGVVGLERSKKQAELSKIQAELRQVLKEQEEKLENKERLFKQINEEARETEDHCESVIVCVTECLQKHYLSVRRLIRAQAEEAGARVPALGLKVEEMKAADAELERLARSENSARFLQEWPRVRSLCKDMLQFFTDPLPPFEVTRRAVEQLGRQLEELCDQLFASVYHAPDRDEQEEERSGASISQPHGLDLKLVMFYPKEMFKVLGL
uniref:Tripartite motif-containing protein 16-like protein n=1 Tax=Kryptolebias marmoratus TaxID=37003 RepID=A0A3Q3BH97_KRYMA